jgi:hypothetical protein
MPCNTLLCQRALFRFGAVMFLETRKFYAVRVEDLKPIRGHECDEILDADELVYFVGAEVECVVLADVCVGVAPEHDERAN